MFKDKRNHFRYDVMVPLYIEPLASEGAFISFSKHASSYQANEAEMHALNVQLETYFRNPKYICNGGVQLFSEVNQKLSFLAYLLESAAQGHDPRTDTDFAHRYFAQKKLVAPQQHEASPFISLVQAIYHRIDTLTNELVSAFDKSIRGKAFMFTRAAQPNLTSQNYLPKLNAMAEKGNWLAQVAETVLAKLNIYEEMLRSLKASSYELSNSQQWPLEQINLGAGGFAVTMAPNYQVGDEISVLFLLDGHYVMAQATCVAVDRVAFAANEVRAAFRFDAIQSEDEALIVRFLNAKALSDARQQLHIQGLAA